MLFLQKYPFKHSLFTDFLNFYSFSFSIFKEIRFSEKFKSQKQNATKRRKIRGKRGMQADSERQDNFFSDTKMP